MRWRTWWGRARLPLGLGSDAEYERAGAKPAAPPARPVPDSLREWVRFVTLVAIFASIWVVVDLALWFWDSGDSIADRLVEGAIFGVFMAAFLRWSDWRRRRRRDEQKS